MNQPSTNFEEPVTVCMEPEIKVETEPKNDEEKEVSKWNNIKTEIIRPAGFFIRVAAYIIDYLIVGAIITMIKFPLWFVKLTIPGSLIFKNLIFDYDFFDILTFCLLSAYFIIMTYNCGRTVGKMLMKIKVVPTKSNKLTFGQVFFREVIGKYLSGLLFIGYILVGIDTEKRGIHDMVADTRVVYDIR